VEFNSSFAVHLAANISADTIKTKVDGTQLFTVKEIFYFLPKGLVRVHPESKLSVKKQKNLSHHTTNPIFLPADYFPSI